MPPTMMAMMGFSRETFAAKDCLDKNDVAKACAHWQNVLAVIDKLSLALDDSRGELEALMADHDCADAPSPDAGRAPDAESPPDPTAPEAPE